MKLPKGVLITEIGIMLEQDNDSEDSNDMGQHMTIDILDAGGGPYAIISTNRWAVDGGKDLTMLADLIDVLIGMAKS